MVLVLVWLWNKGWIMCFVILYVDAEIFIRWLFGWERLMTNFIRLHSMIVFTFSKEIGLGWICQRIGVDIELLGVIFNNGFGFQVSQFLSFPKPIQI